MIHFIKEILQYFKLFNLQKISNSYKYNNINCMDFCSPEQITESFALNKFKTYIIADCDEFIQPIKKLSSCIDAVNKVLDGKTEKHESNNFYCSSGFIDNIVNDDDISIFRKINLYKKESYVKTSTVSFYNEGLYWHPLVSNDSLNSDSYIYTIYKYLCIKTQNNYMSCFTALFYYYFGKLFSLIKIYKKNDINVIESNLSILISKLASFVSISNIESVACCSPKLISIKFINIINISLVLSNLEPYKYKPYLIGLTKYILTSNGIFAKLSFQETLKTLKNIVFEHKIDWKVDSESNIIVSDFIPVGSGWYRYFMD